MLLDGGTESDFTSASSAEDTVAHAETEMAENRDFNTPDLHMPLPTNLHTGHLNSSITMVFMARKMSHNKPDAPLTKTCQRDYYKDKAFWQLQSQHFTLYFSLRGLCQLEGPRKSTCLATC